MIPQHGACDNDHDRGRAARLYREHAAPQMCMKLDGRLKQENQDGDRDEIEWSPAQEIPRRFEMNSHKPPQQRPTASPREAYRSPCRARVRWLRNLLRTPHDQSFAQPQPGAEGWPRCQPIWRNLIMKSRVRRSSETSAADTSSALLSVVTSPLAGASVRGCTWSRHKG